MEEVLARRVSQLLEQSDRSPHDSGRDESFASVPDLIVIDGGKGQLSAGMRALAPLVERGTAVIGLAKRLEEVYVPGRSEPLEIAGRLGGAAAAAAGPRRGAPLRARPPPQPAQQGDDRARCSTSFAASGPIRKRALLEHFGSPDRLVAASREELEAVPGIPGKLARDIHRQLNKAG